MQLIEAWMGDLGKTYELFQQFPADENGFENDAAGMNRDKFEDYLRELKNTAAGINLPEGYVPATKYILVDDDGAYVGIFNLRHRINDFLRKGPGHIGYGIAPAYRGKGYATAGLKLTLEKAHNEFGIDEAYLSVHKTNVASLKVQQHCGARIDHEDNTHYYTRITIVAAH